MSYLYMLVLKHIYSFPLQLVIGKFWKQNPDFNFFCMGLIEKKDWSPDILEKV